MTADAPAHPGLLTVNRLHHRNALGGGVDAAANRLGITGSAARLIRQNGGDPAGAPEGPAAVNVVVGNFVFTPPNTAHHHLPLNTAQRSNGKLRCMTVKVTLTTRAPNFSRDFTVDEYPHEADAYWTDGEGRKLEVVKHDGTVATYPPGSWGKVEGKRGGVPDTE